MLKGFFTFEQWANLPPAGDASLAGVLTQGNLQEEDRYSTRKQEDQVGDEECTWAGKDRKVFKSKHTHTHTFLEDIGQHGTSCFCLCAGS